jgi:hypothetical protein
VPALREIEPGHRAACHYAEQAAADAEAIVAPTEGG